MLRACAELMILGQFNGRGTRASKPGFYHKCDFVSLFLVMVRYS